MKIRTIGAIVLIPRRIQGQYKYMSLDTGEKIYGKVVTIQRVETLVQTQQQTFSASRMLQYEWRPIHDVADNDSNIDVPDDE